MIAKSSRDLRVQPNDGSQMALPPVLGLDPAVTLGRHGVLLFLRNDTVIGACLQKYGEWAEAEIQFLCSFLTPGAVALDVGANVGTHTLAFARAGATVYAFEPQLPLFRLLSANVAANGLETVRLFHAGVAATPGQMLVPTTDYGATANFGAIALERPPVAGAGPTGDTAGAVKVLAIDDLDLPQCDLIKIDVEGMEPDVLAGAVRTLERHRPLVYLECVLVSATWASVLVLKERGYRTFLRFSQAYNSDNLLGDKEDIFNGAKEAAIVGIPPGRADWLAQTLAAGGDVIPIDSLDELAAHVVETSQMQDMKWQILAVTRRANELEVLADARTAELDRLGQDFQAQVAQIERLEERASRGDARSAELEAELATSSDRALEEAALRQAEVAALRASAQERDEALARARAEAVERSRGLDQLGQQVAASAAAVERLELDIARRHAERRQLAEQIAELSRTVDDLRDDLAAGRQRIAAVTAELAERTRELGVALGSRSWRVTKPLRDVASMLPMVKATQRARQAWRRLRYAVAQRHHLWIASRVVARCALFDRAFYLETNPDVAAAGIEPIEHYLRRGAAAGLDPHPLFDTSFYLEQNADVAASRINPLLHYLRRGAREGRAPHPLFDPAYYRSQVLDLRDEDALAHYVARGARQGTDPHPLFDSAYYLAQKPDLAAAGGNPLVHYLRWGAREGKCPHPIFDTGHYLAQHPELVAAGGNPLVHYVCRGAHDRIDPHPLFDTAHYLGQGPDLAVAGGNPLVHFLRHGAWEGKDPHPLFDSSFYLERNPDVLADRTNPLAHYLTRGADQGRDPNPLFHTSWYRHQQAEQARSALPVTVGGPRRRRPPAPSTGTSTVYAFTSICLNYVPKARVLATTLKQHQPGIRFCLLVNEPVPDWAVDQLDVFDEVVEIGDLPIADPRRWIFTHSMVELCTAVKGFYAAELLARPDCAGVFFFDPDIAVFGGLQPLLDALEQSSILLTPHQIEPETTPDAIADNEICSLQHGVYNLGFLGLRPSPEGRRFVEWWRERLARYCVADIPRGLFTDQRWVDLAPAFFEDIRIIRHPGCNVATWNLTHRRVEGSFADGFTVNGQPLVFYHFSGFDSGAQEIMLTKYGSGMPAAHELRRWYVAETEREADAAFRGHAWAHGFYSNGTPVTLEQRRVYRERGDLQRAFPDSFDATPGTPSYLEWYRTEILREPYPEPVRPGTETTPNPLVHFLRTWRNEDLSPNPHFDPKFYLARYPDVVVAGTNPLAHYLHTGGFDGRDPAPGFDGAYYRGQLGSAAETTHPLVHYLTIGRSQGWRTNNLFDGARNGRELRILQRWCAQKPAVILMVTHYGGGGTEKHVRELAAHVEDRARCLLLTPARNSAVSLAPADRFLDTRLWFDPVAQRELLVAVLHELGVQRLHIHHALGNEHYLRALVASAGLPFDFTVHDYYTVAPNMHLTGHDARFVGEDLSAHADALLRNPWSTQAPQSLIEWRAAHQWLIREAERVIAPSGDVARRLTRHYPGVRVLVAAHPERQVPRPGRPWRALPADQPLRVAVLGELMPHKGSHVLAGCARLSAQRNGRLAFFVFGEPSGESGDLLDAGVWISGRYEEMALEKLLAEHPPDLVWYPAQWPETYSYTLSAGLATGLPIIAPDLGAFPERVAGRSWTWVVPWDLEPEEWLALFERIRQEHFVPGSPPPVPIGDGSPAVAGFYHDDYLARPRSAAPKTGQ